MKFRLVAWVLRLYPRSWRDRYGGEVADLTEELVESGTTSQPRGAAGLAAFAAVERARSLRHPHHILVAAGVAVILAFGALAVTTALSSGPKTVAGPINFQNVRGFQAVCEGEGSCKKVGYANKRDLLVGLAAPVYLRDHKTLVGHFYNGIGFVPLSTSPWSLPCQADMVDANGTTSTVPCRRDVRGPGRGRDGNATAVGELSGLGIAWSFTTSTRRPFRRGISPRPRRSLGQLSIVINRLLSSISVAKSVPVGYD